MDTEQLAGKLNQARRTLEGMTGGRRRKSRASSRKSAKRGSKKGGGRRGSRKASRASSRKSRRGSKKGGARRSRKASRAPSRKSSRKSSRRGSLRRGLNPAIGAIHKVARYVEKQLGVKFSVGIAKLVGKMNDIAKRGMKDEKDYAEKAKRAMEAFDDHLEKQGKAKIIAEIERNNEDARKKRMKK